MEHTTEAPPARRQSGFRKRAMLALSALVFPLLLAAGGWTQLRYLTSTDLDLDVQERAVTSNIALLKKARSDGATTVTVTDDRHGRRDVSINDVLDVLNKRRSEAGQRATYNARRRAIAMVPIASGVLVACISVLGLCAVHGIRSRARQSREALIRWFGVGRRFLIPAIMVQSVAICLGLVALAVFHGFSVFDVGMQDSLPTVLFCSAVVIAAICFFAGANRRLLASLREALADPPMELRGETIGRTEAPRLWELVDTIARRVGSEIPEAIVIGLTEGFFVTDHDITAR